VTAVTVSGPPPAALGGTIATGTYWLTKREFYPAAADTGETAPTDTVRRTLVFDPNKYLLAEQVEPGDAGASWTYNADLTYTVSAGVVNTVESCPAPGSIGSVFYMVSGKELWLLPDNDLREVYELQ
jgi:hypothetical protein